MILLIDAGNTRVKWALVGEPNHWLHQGSVACSEVTLLAEQWQVLPQPIRIIGSCVAGKTIALALERLAQHYFALSVNWLKVSAEYGGVKNGYAYTIQSSHYQTTLGPDRWAALIAAHHLYPGHRVIVNVGTAMTVDALTAQGEFIGGMILPGVQLMQQALHTYAAELPLSQGEYDHFPTNTADAIHSGIITALVSTVTAMTQRLKVWCQANEVSCIISGGYASTIFPYLELPAQLVEALVLKGLMVIAQQPDQKSN